MCLAARKRGKSTNKEIWWTGKNEKISCGTSEGDLGLKAALILMSMFPTNALVYRDFRPTRRLDLKTLIPRVVGLSEMQPRLG